ncbi:MAG: ArnT family glycosyltransferase [Thermodesulfobacteriota bacterium]
MIKGKDHIIFLAVLMLASILLFKNLGNIYLWQDEAETAVISQNILKFSLPMAWDGRNLVSQSPDEELHNSEYVWVQHPWFQYYVTALSFFIFGKSTFAARFPFALFGLLSIVFVYYLTLQLTKEKGTSLFAGFLSAISLPLILYSRQCRYYSAVMFFSLLAIYSLTVMKEGKRKYIPHS